MAGKVFQCGKCNATIRSGYPTYAIEFASSKRGVPIQEIIDDFFEYNKDILREEPEKCPKCGAAKEQLKLIKEHD